MRTHPRDWLAIALLAMLALPLAAAALHVSRAASSPLEECAAQVPFGAPEAPVPVTLLCRKGYLAGHDNARRLPLWVAERLTPASAWGCGARVNAFAPDPDLPKGQRGETADYLRSGYDLGHMASSANHLADAQEQRETFYLSNMTPQLHALNAGLWFKLEVMARVWAAQRPALVVFSGPILAEGLPHIGPGRIPVPAGFWKMLADPATGETLAFSVPHDAALTWRTDPGRYVVRIADLESATGLRFPRPAGWAVRMEPVAPWPIDVTLADNLKASSCPAP